MLPDHRKRLTGHTYSKAGAADREIRGKDQANFEWVWPSLSAEAKEWLKETLSHTQPGHPWLERL